MATPKCCCRASYVASRRPSAWVDTVGGPLAVAGPGFYHCRTTTTADSGGCVGSRAVTTEGPAGAARGPVDTAERHEGRGGGPMGDGLPQHTDSAEAPPP
jgi:hypothetical protein